MSARAAEWLRETWSGKEDAYRELQETRLQMEQQDETPLRVVAVYTRSLEPERSLGRYVAALAVILAVIACFVVAWVAVFGDQEPEPGAVLPTRGWE